MTDSHDDLSSDLSEALGVSSYLMKLLSSKKKEYKILMEYQNQFGKKYEPI